MNIEQKFGNNVKMHRKKLGMSQEALALEMDVDQAYISRIEAGNKNITLQTIDKIAVALNISISELFADQ